MDADEPRTADPAAPEEPAREGSSPPARRRPARRADGMDRPEFVLDFPEDPELERLIAAFEAGNYALVRTDAPRLAASTESPAVRDAALELRRRIEPDPLAKYLLAISVLLLVFLTVWAYGVSVH
jgi:hypothetical protein